MNTMLSVVTLIALVAASLAGVYIPEFSEQELENLKLMDPVQGITAKLSNPNGKVQLKAADGSHQCAATFEADVENVSNNNDKVGIELNKKENVFYDLSFFNIILAVDEIKGRKVWSLVILLMLDPKDKEKLLLTIPVFTTPSSKKEGYGLMHTRKWTAENRVVVFAPVVEDALKAALESGKLEFDYLWLEELLSFDVYPSEMPNPLGDDDSTLIYATRPLVISESTKNVLVEIVHKFNLKDEVDSKEFPCCLLSRILRKQRKSKSEDN